MDQARHDYQQEQAREGDGERDEHKETVPPRDTFIDAVNVVRTEIKDIAQQAKFLADVQKNNEGSSREGEDRKEMIANLVLCYRHLEDASMRLGKAIQARDGGISVYDRATTVGA